MASKIVPLKALASGVALCALSAGASWAADSSNPSSSNQPQATQSAPAAGQSGQAQGHANAQLKGSDKAFFEKAAQGGMAEVEMAKLALERASSADVKSFAETLQRDHTTANQKLMQIAQQKGLDAPKQLSAEQRKTLDKLSNLKGDEFDKAFMKEAGMKDHKKDIQLFERQAKEGKDAELKAFASETLPTLKSHLQMAQKIGGGAHTAQGGKPAGSSADAQSDATERPAAAKQQ